ncbi:MAG: glycosyltransferase family 39 protein [Candidatus Omnitrophica bacterium]|nr:glycosyltransferase family 39 protein [Candidatus Omnitrophota bacterium]MBU3929183.1 glycosyltransferase family 39 protein [bacterium]
MRIFADAGTKLRNIGFSKSFVYGFPLFVISFFTYFIFTRLSPIPEQQSDAVGYIVAAKDVAAGIGFTCGEETLSASRPPLFPAVLAFWFTITKNMTVQAMVILQILFQSLGIWVSFILLSRMFSQRVSFLGGLFIALNPFLFTELVYILQEPMLLLLTTFSAYLTVCWLRDQTYTKAVLVGFFWGIATLGKIVTMHAPLIFWVMWLLSKLFRKLNWNLSWKKLVVISGIFILTLTPWTVRNYLQFNKFILINDMGTEMHTVFFHSSGIFGKTAGNDYVKNLKQQGLPPKEFRAKIFKYMASHPGETLLKITQNVFSFTNVSREWFGHVAGVSMRWYIWIVPAVLIQFPLYIGLFAGLLYERRIEIMFLSLFYLVYWAGYSVCWGIPRYAVPVYPILVALGLNGWRYLKARRKIIINNKGENI